MGTQASEPSLVLSRVSLQRAGSEVEGLGLKQDNYGTLALQAVA